jgi:hypothetical protein
MTPGNKYDQILDDKLRMAAQNIALTVIVKAILANSPNVDEIIATVKLLSDAGFKNADSRLQSEIDTSLMNWINSI